MNSRLACAVLLGVAVTLASDTSAQTAGVAWRADFATAQAEARQTGKLLLVHFWTESCGPCKLLDTRVYSQQSVAVAVNEQFIPVKVNAELSPEIARAYKVTRVPTDAVVAPSGQLVRQFVSPASPMEYVGYVSQVAAAYRTQAGSAYAASVAGAPMQSATAVAAPGSSDRTTAINEAYAALTAAPAAAQPAKPPVESAPPAVARTTNPFANQPATAASRQTTQPPAPSVTAPSPTAPAAAQVTAQAAVQLPPGSPPLGFDGFCPVTMKQEWRWAKGDVRWGAIHEGRTYLFASQAAQREFLTGNNASKYAPVLAGADVVAAVDQRQQANGKRDFAVEYPTGSGQFYLFANQKNLEKFWSDPSSYAQGAQRVAALPAGASFIR